MDPGNGDTYKNTELRTLWIVFETQWQKDQSTVDVCEFTDWNKDQGEFVSTVLYDLI